MQCDDVIKLLEDGIMKFGSFVAKYLKILCGEFHLVF